MRITSIALIVLFLGACSFKKDKEAPVEATNGNPDVIDTISKEQDKQAAEGILTVNNISVQFEETEEPGIYRMTVAWPKSIRRMQIQVGNRNEIVLNPQSQYSDVVRHNTGIDISLTSFDQLGAPISSIQVQRQSPRDYVVSDVLSLSEDTTIEANRFFVLESGQVITNGFGLSINTSKLIIKSRKNLSGITFFESSHILTNNPGTIARSPRDLMGSNIAITAKEAYGSLKIALIGVQGQNGRSGNELYLGQGPQIKSEPTLNGKDGEPGKIIYKTRPCASRNDIPCESEVPLCEKAPTSGENGKAGTQGTTGENGWNGGNTGNLAVIIQNGKDFSLEIGKRRGPPGKGGLGGDGGSGGLGGKAGLNPGHPCPSASAGQNGPMGLRGNSGKDGEPGADGTITTSPFKVDIKEI